MDIENFQENLDLMNYSGFNLTETEAVLIENSLKILQSENKLEKIFFVGRIETSSELFYNIACGYQNDILKDRKFFYCLNDYEWTLLPVVKSRLVQTALKSRSMLLGDPLNIENVYMNKTCDGKIQKIKEIDRLSIIVHKFVSESAIMPRGILYRQVNHCITYNPCFKGLDRVEVRDIKNFQLFRFPMNGCNNNLAKRNDYNYQTDFFDTIEDVSPQNCFSRIINNHDVCIVRSLIWPGMTFCHKLNTKYHGFSYFGNGLKNCEFHTNMT